jgi:hypothetical protein
VLNKDSSEKPNPWHANRLGLQRRSQLPLNHLCAAGVAVPRKLAGRILKMIDDPAKTAGNDVGFDNRTFEQVGRLEMQICASCLATKIAPI